MSVDREQAVAEARAAGKLAGQLHRARGVPPVPPAAIDSGSLLMRRCASAWHAGLAEGRAGQGTATRAFNPSERRGEHGRWAKGGAAGQVLAADSLAKHTTAPGKLTPQRQALHDQIVAETLAGHERQSRPQAVFLGGGSASGKSTVMGKVAGGDHVHIDADAIKARLPEYQAMAAAGDTRAAAYSHEESSVLSKRITAEATARRHSYLLDGTGDGSFDKMAAKIDAAKRAGYQVDGKYVTVDTDEALRRAEKRAKRTGRKVPESVIREIHASVSDVFARLVMADKFDTVELWDNNGAAPVLVGQKKLGGKWAVLDKSAWQRFLDKAKA